LNSVYIGIEEGLKYLPLILAACILFRVAHFPDIGIEGTFALGSSFIAFSSQLNCSFYFGLIGSGLVGALGGLLTATLFVKYRLNSLLCGIITTFASYSTCFCLLGFKSNASFETQLSEVKIGLLGLVLGIALCIFFSTRYGLLLRIAGESPALLQKLGINTNRKIIYLLLLGNFISGLSGALVSSVEGTSSLFIADSKLFLVIISMVIGEGLLSLILYIKELSLFQFFNFSIISEYFINIFYGAGVSYLVISAIIGSFSYWIIYNVCTNFFGADEFTQIILGCITAILLIFTNKTTQNTYKLPPWTFIGDINID